MFGAPAGGVDLFNPLLVGLGGSPPTAEILEIFLNLFFCLFPCAVGLILEILLNFGNGIPASRKFLADAGSDSLPLSFL
jgi:hypothetical protein